MTEEELENEAAEAAVRAGMITLTGQTGFIRGYVKACRRYALPSEEEVEEIMRSNPDIVHFWKWLKERTK